MSENEAEIECRACLSSVSVSGCRNIFLPWCTPWSQFGSTIAYDLARVANVEVADTDNWPHMMCNKCCSELYRTCQFIATVHHSAEVLQQRDGNQSTNADSSGQNIMVLNPETDKEWPRPIQLEKSVNCEIFRGSVEVEVKQEVLSDEQFAEVVVSDGCRASGMDIKVEPEEMMQPASANGTQRRLANGGEVYEDEEYLDQPMKEHHSDVDMEQALSDLSLDCLLCTKKFLSMSGLKAHVIAHHSYKTVKRKSADAKPSPIKTANKHICATCRRLFATSTDLMVHETCHNKSACYGCNQKFDSFDQLRKHRRRCKSTKAQKPRMRTLGDVMRPPNKTPLKCVSCEELFSDVYYLNIHNEIHHNSQAKSDQTNGVIEDTQKLKNEESKVKENEVKHKNKEEGEDKLDVSQSNVQIDVSLETEQLETEQLENMLACKDGQQSATPEPIPIEVELHNTEAEENREQVTESNEKMTPDGDQLDNLLEFKDSQHSADADCVRIQVEIETEHNEEEKEHDVVMQPNEEMSVDVNVDLDSIKKQAETIDKNEGTQENKTVSHSSEEMDIETEQHENLLLCKDGEHASSADPMEIQVDITRNNETEEEKVEVGCLPNEKISLETEQLLLCKGGDHSDTAESIQVQVESVEVVAENNTKADEQDESSNEQVDNEIISEDKETRESKLNEEDKELKTEENGNVENAQTSELQIGNKHDSEVENLKSKTGDNLDIQEVIENGANNEQIEIKDNNEDVESTRKKDLTFHEIALELGLPIDGATGEQINERDSEKTINVAVAFESNSDGKSADTGFDINIDTVVEVEKTDESLQRIEMELLSVLDDNENI